MDIMTRFPFTVARVVPALAVVFLAVATPEVGAQTLDLDLSLNQSFTSLDVLHSPTGFSLAATSRRVFRPVGVQVGYRQLSEYDGRIARTCGFASCAEGPFDRSYSLRTLHLGLFVDVPAPLPGELGVGVTGSLSWQAKRLEHLAGGESFDAGESGPDAGLGVYGDWRFGSVAWRFHPFVSAQYERIGSSSACAADAPCFGARSVTTLALGVAWRVP